VCVCLCLSVCLSVSVYLSVCLSGLSVCVCENSTPCHQLTSQYPRNRLRVRHNSGQATGNVTHWCDARCLVFSSIRWVKFETGLEIVSESFNHFCCRWLSFSYFSFLLSRLKLGGRGGGHQSLVTVLKGSVDLFLTVTCHSITVRWSQSIC